MAPRFVGGRRSDGRVSGATSGKGPAWKRSRLGRRWALSRRVRPGSILVDAPSPSWTFPAWTDVHCGRVQLIGRLDNTRGSQSLVRTGAVPRQRPTNSHFGVAAAKEVPMTLLIASTPSASRSLPSAECPIAFSSKDAVDCSQSLLASAKSDLFFNGQRPPTLCLSGCRRTLLPGLQPTHEMVAKGEGRLQCRAEQTGRLPQG